MAAAAKPLLVQLRDNLEEDEFKENLRDYLKERYRPAYLLPREYKFKNDLADRVNFVLSLYMDRTEAEGHERREIARLLDEGRKYYDDYRTTFQNLRPVTTIDGTIEQDLSALPKSAATDQGGTPRSL